MSSEKKNFIGSHFRLVRYETGGISVSSEPLPDLEPFRSPEFCYQH
jgi:hypothetical protein